MVYDGIDGAGLPVLFRRILHVSMHDYTGITHAASVRTSEYTVTPSGTNVLRIAFVFLAICLRYISDFA